jgi:hypothetical protein
LLFTVGNRAGRLPIAGGARVLDLASGARADPK